jgi:hypothetical protein
MGSSNTARRATTVLATLAFGIGSAHAQQMTRAEFSAALANARVDGPAGRPVLTIPLELPGWAADAGVLGRVRKYKGICGPDGAAATIEQLVAHAERDLMGHSTRGTAVTTVGASPTFKITHDATDSDVLGLYLPDFVAAAQYIDGQFNNRLTASVTLHVQRLDDSIGSASSEFYLIPWSIYVEGLREADDRESETFADALPTDALPVRFGFPGTPVTDLTSVFVTDTQARAIFGDSVADERRSVSITLDKDNDWVFFGCGDLPGSGEGSLIDVAVHEIGHSFGFSSSIVEGGANPTLSATSIDVARFLDDPSLGAVPGVPGGPPTNVSEFTTFPRHLQGSVGSAATRHRYVSADGFNTLLEEGDGRQPVHLRYYDLFIDKLGLMDPVLNSGTSYCPQFFNLNDIRPLDDIGWTYVYANIFADCNGNGQPDLVDIGNGAPDTNTNNIPDSCEFFAAPVNPGATRTGLTLSDWAAPILSSLDGFNPDSYTLQFRGESEDASITYGGNTGIVVRFSGYFDAPATGEYAFRVEHSEAATLRVAGQSLLAINGAREIQLVDVSDTEGLNQIAPQNFINLNAGLHEFELTCILNSSGDAADIFADAPVYGGWGRLGSGDFYSSVDDFPDCDGNGVDDQFDPDANGDGVPDACGRDCDSDGVDDAVQFAGDLADRVFLGTIATPGTPVTLETVGSDFDTEIALFFDSGNLIAENDDIDLQNGNSQSRIVQALNEGTYLLCVSGWSVEFDDGPAINFPGDCSSSGTAVVTAAGVTTSGEALSIADAAPIGSGRSRWYEFRVGAAVDCDGEGTPDELQIADDLAGLTMLGVVGEPFENITFETVGSSFDTEIALFNAETGAFIAANDDIEPGNRQSRIVQRFGAGSYLLGVGGYNIEFLGGPEIVFPAGCSVGGSLTISAGLAGTISDPTPLVSGRTRWYQFSVATIPDCDGDGTPDSQEQDCDGNGIPDECEDLGTVAGSIDLGVVGEAGTININTVGSGFDTELGLWDLAGTLVASNDDIVPGNLQSEIEIGLAPGVYFVSVSGYNTFFGDFFDADTLADAGCEEGGGYTLTVAGTVTTGSIDPEHAQFCRFEVVAPTPCNAADLAEPFGLLDLSDINAFASAFLGERPARRPRRQRAVRPDRHQPRSSTAFVAGCP